MEDCRESNHFAKIVYTVIVVIYTYTSDIPLNYSLRELHVKLKTSITIVIDNQLEFVGI